jgi:hypothetical protein
MNLWEDDGADLPDQNSAPNRMTLAEAQRNFESFGACSEYARKHVLVDGSERYSNARD